MSTVEIIPIIMGSNPPVEVQLYDVATDLPISLVGAGGGTFSATAKSPDATITFPSVVVSDAALGKVKLSYATTTFATAGTYNVQIKYQDAAGNWQVYPSEAGQLRVKVGAANT